MSICKFCNKVCKNANSHRNHERLCNLNENRQSTPFQRLEFQQNKIPGGGGTNRFIKAKKLGLPPPEISEETRRLAAANIKRRTPEFNATRGKKASKTIVGRVAVGGWHTSLAKHMHIDYNGVDLHGSWEVAYAKHLDDTEIEWIRCKDVFPYRYQDRERKYTPDFYLIEDDVYIEIKGYKTEKDSAKWKQFPADKTLIVLMKLDLIQMGLI